MKVLPLSNYRVIDFGTAWAGPMAAQLLADLGAQVIKVESRTRLDGLRLGRPIVGEDAAGGDRGLWPELQPVFHGINRNKLGVTLDLKTPEGLGLVKELIARSDVVMNNYSPGVLERLGLDYPQLRKLRPDIILVSMPSVGETGPLRDILAYAPIIQALSGLMSLVGYPATGPGLSQVEGSGPATEEETLVGELQAPWSDVVAALHAALAAVAALRHRNRTGEGQFIEVAQLEATTAMLGEGILGYQMTGQVPAPQGNFDPDFAPHNNYPCVSDDEWVAIAVGTEEEWRAFCRALGSPAWAGQSRFRDKAGRLAHIQELDRHVSAWTRRHSAGEITRLLQEQGVAAMPVMNIADQFADPHWQERQAYVDIEHPHVGAEWVYGTPWLLSDTPGSVRTPAPTLGQHNQYVFCQLLGLPARELKRLEDAQVVY